MILHAGLIARRVGGDWRGVLIRGASGAGKSDLALRALNAGWRLVADDRVVVWPSGDRLWGRAPEKLAGFLEGRGVGIVGAVALRLAPVDLVVDDADAGTVERLPEPDMVDVCGVSRPRLRLRLLDGSTPAKLALALDASVKSLGARTGAGY